MKKSARLAQSIVGTAPGRLKHDFYQTPKEATLGLLKVEQFDSHIWEPACGDGAISEVLKQDGFTVFSSDLIDRGYGEETKDFLLYSKAVYKTIITNPPFKLSVDFVIHAQKIGIEKIALLLKLTFLEGQYRSYILEQTKLSKVWVFRDRLIMTRNKEPIRGGGMIAFAWFVWDKNHDGPPLIGWTEQVFETDLYQIEMELA